MGYAKALLGVLLVSALAATSTVQANFTCKSTGPTCTALVDFVALNATNLAAIKTLFQVKKFSNLIGANNLPTSTSINRTVSAGETIRIPFTCLCANGTGVSDGTPVYTVQSGDSMYTIAHDRFAGLVTYQQIAAANKVTDASKIEAGQRFWIPLPCSCDDVDGIKVVHYGYVVPKGSTVEAIAQAYGTTQATLLSLNQMGNASELQAGQVLDVPLKACSSNVNSSSLDYPLLVANDTYLYTASNCVKCKCGSTNNYTLQCEPSGLKPLSNWTTCPAMQCQGAGSLYIGNATSSGCNQTTCAYTGYTNQTILAALVTQSTCPASAATKIGFQGLRWNFLLISIQAIFFCLHRSQ